MGGKREQGIINKYSMNDKKNNRQESKETIKSGRE